MESVEEKIFIAKVTKGYIPKVAFDALSTNMQKIPLQLTKKGIYIRVGDKEPEPILKSHVMWDMTWSRNKFVEYKCKKRGTISLNGKHLHKLLKTVKKKDSLTFFINKSNLDQLFITIQPAGTGTGAVRKSETVVASIQWVDNIVREIPGKYIDEKNITKEAYGDPMVIASTDFQKIKKLTSICKTSITIIIQKSNYISFRVSQDKTMGNILEYGELSMYDEDSSDSSDSNDSQDSKDESEESECSEKNTEESSESENKNKPAPAEIKNSDPFSKYPEIYKKEFDAELFSSLVKLPGLCTQMEFYAPKVAHFPLKMTMTASSGLTEISVFIKDKEQVALIEG
jgi:hypothetical protein